MWVRRKRRREGRKKKGGRKEGEMERREGGWKYAYSHALTYTHGPGREVCHEPRTMFNPILCI